jgi:hypothetical protein
MEGRRCRCHSFWPVFRVSPRPDVRRGQLRGAELREEAEACPVPSGGAGEGKTGRANVSEPPLMPRYPEPWEMGRRPGCRAWPWRNGKRRPGKFHRPCEHRWPRGRGGAHPGRSSRMRNVETPTGSGVPSGAAGKQEVTKAQVPGGNRMPRKPMPVRRKATGNRDDCPVLPLAVPHNRPDTGLLPGPERVLTWAGEPLKRCGQTRRNRRASWTPC